MARPKYHPGSVIGVPFDGRVGVAILARWSRHKQLGWKFVFFYGFDRVERLLPLAIEAQADLQFRVSDARLERWGRAIEAARKAFPSEAIQ